MRSAQTTARQASAPNRPRRDMAPSAATIERIAHFHGRGLRVVSTYVATTAGSDARRELRTKADSLLHEIRSLGDDRSLDHTVRMSLRGDMQRIDAVIDSEPISHGTLVIFSCTGAGLFEVVGLPRVIRDRIVVDETAWIRPLLAVLDEYRRCCSVVVDRESAHLWELYLGELRDAGRLRGRALRDPAHGGWHGLSEHGVRNKADELARRHFREVAAALDLRFREDRYDLLAVGGHEHELPVFLELLPRSLRERVADTFAVDPHTATAATIRARADAILERYELDEQRHWVADVLAAVAAGGLAVAGLEPCLRAGSMTAVSALYVQEGAIVPGVVCDASRWFATDGEACPVCGAPMRRTPDVIDELVEAVIDEGGAIHHVRADTDLREHVAAAHLRFALPPVAP